MVYYLDGKRKPEPETMERPSGASDGKMPFETALDMAAQNVLPEEDIRCYCADRRTAPAGSGTYSYMMTALAGLIATSFGFIAFGTTYIIPTSACELQTTSAQQGLISSAPLAGLILGAIIGGYLGDVYGRRRVLLHALLSSAIVNALASLSVNWQMLVVLQSVASFCGSGQYSVAMALLSESVPMKKRSMLVLLVNSLFLFHQGIMTVMAIPIIPLRFSIYLSALGIYWNSWRTLLLLFSLPSLLAALWLSFLMESPKYVFAQGREREAIDIIENIHRVNRGRAAGALKIEGLMLDGQDLDTPASPIDQIVPLFKMPLLKYTIVLTALFTLQQHGAFSVWLPSIANQFVRTVQTGEGIDQDICGILDDSRGIPADPDEAPCSLNLISLLFILILGVLQCGTNVLLSLAVGRAGRRNLAMAVVGATGAAGVLTALVPNAYASAALMVVFMVGIVVSGLYAAMAVALFPTHLRAFAVALTMTGGRLSTFAVIQILNLLLEVNCAVGFYLLNSLFAASAFILFFLPDDRLLQKTLQTSIREAKTEN